MLSLHGAQQQQRAAVRSRPSPHARPGHRLLHAPHCSHLISGFGCPAVHTPGLLRAAPTAAATGTTVAGRTRRRTARTRAGACRAVADEKSEVEPSSYPSFPGGEFSVPMQVRDYELDAFNVVNNAVYSQYFQHGRHEAFHSLGFDVDAFARAGAPLALSELKVAFRVPLRSRDVFRVTVTVARVTPARAVLRQQLLLQLKPTGQAAAPPAAGQEQQAAKAAEEVVAAEAEATVVFLDEAYRPARMPAAIQRAFRRLAEQRSSG